MRRANFVQFSRLGGFTLIELMMTLVILAILAAIAIPSYSEFIMRGKLMDAHGKLGDLRAQQERYFLDNRTYAAATAGAPTCGIQDTGITMLTTYNADGGRSFDLTCVATATTYTITATGRAAKGMTGFTFNVGTNNARSSSGPTGWTSSGNCWIVRKNGDCS